MRLEFRLLNHYFLYYIMLYNKLIIYYFSLGALAFGAKFFKVYQLKNCYTQSKGLLKRSRLHMVLKKVTIFCITMIELQNLCPKVLRYGVPNCRSLAHAQCHGSL